MRVSLFITCFNDTIFPRTGQAVVRLLERLGHEVDFPMDQTCCGQMHYNTGYQLEAIPLIRRFIQVFEQSEVVVSPSASCVGMVRHMYPHAAELAGDPGLARAVARGNYTLWLAEQGYDVTWNDLRADLEGYVRLKHERGSVRYAPGDAFKLEFPEPFDLVIITEIIEHVAHPDEFLAQVARLTRPGGYVLLSTPNGGYFLSDRPRFSDPNQPIAILRLPEKLKHFKGIDLKVVPIEIALRIAQNRTAILFVDKKFALSAYRPTTG